MQESSDNRNTVVKWQANERRCYTYKSVHEYVISKLHDVIKRWKNHKNHKNSIELESFETLPRDYLHYPR